MNNRATGRTANLPPPVPVFLLPSWRFWRTKPTPHAGDERRDPTSFDSLSSSSGSSESHLCGPRPDTLRCGTCSSDIAFGAQIVSKGFTGRHGRAFLVSPPCPWPGTPACPGVLLPTSAELVNVSVGRPENRQLVTGAHVVADIACAVCGTKLGWKYVDAREQAQRYKVGKFILETQRVVPYRSWEHAVAGQLAEYRSRLDAFVCRRNDARRGRQPVREKMDTTALEREDQEEEQHDSQHGDETPVVFDSDDSDECEDVFAGTWDAGVVAERRRGKVAYYARKTA